jgi:hypothetical protein
VSTSPFSSQSSYTFLKSEGERERESEGEIHTRSGVLIVKLSKEFHSYLEEEHLRLCIEMIEEKRRMCVHVYVYLDKEV